MLENVTKEEEKVLIQKVVYDLLNDPSSEGRKNTP